MEAQVCYAIGDELPHGAAAAGEHVYEGDDELLLGVVLPPLLLGLGEEEVYVPSHLGLVVQTASERPLLHLTSPSTWDSLTSRTYSRILSRNSSMPWILYILMTPKVLKPPLWRGTCHGRVE